MKNKNRILRLMLSILLIAALVFSVLFVSERNKRFDYGEKNTVAMGTVLTQKIYSERAGQHISHINSIVNSLEGVISWRQQESLVAQLNEGKSVEDSALYEVLGKCAEISRSSDGGFDITVGGVSRLWNIGEEDERIPSESEIEKALKSVGSENIKIENNTVSLTSACSVDLGAVGKGLACDYIMNYLKASDDVSGAVVSVGGSNVAYGNYNKAGDKWRIAVRHPRNENEYLGIISLDEGFVSTSGDYERYFEKDGIRYHHILDARTGYPAASGLISVTVICDSGLLSDALSTACFVLGEKEGRALVEKYGAAAIFVNEKTEISVVGEVDFEAY